MTITLTQLYAILEKKLGKDEAETLTQYVEQKVEEEISSAKEIIVTEVDLKIERAKNEIIKEGHRDKIQLILWILGTGVLQFVAKKYGFI